MFFWIVILLCLALFCCFFMIKAPFQKISWGIDFSQMQTENLGLDWKAAFVAMMDDLGAKRIKLHTQWDWVEGRQGEYYFNDIDWQLQEAQKRGVSFIYVVGMKTGRWPECHIPGWVNHLSKQEQQVYLLRYVKEVVVRYKNNPSIIAWQAENEPLFNFGQCPTWHYDNADFLKKEVALIKSLDPSRPVIISDSGEQSLWIKPAKVGDIVGFTLYRTAWFHVTDRLGFYFNFPLPPISYWLKAKVIKAFFGKEVIGIELQAEPWTSKPFFQVPLEEQEKTMNLEKFKKNIVYAQQTGIDKFYLWGAEWWFWLKETQGKPEIWNEAQKLFMDSL
jgi:hypothetical protein